MSATRCPKKQANLLERRLAALVLYRIVQEGGDRLILAAAVLDNQRGHAEQVRNVGD